MPQVEVIKMIFLFTIAIGVIVLIIGLFFMKNNSNIKDHSLLDQQMEIDQKLKNRIDEADKMIQELNEFSSYLQKELDDKHKELLFLYQFIEEKEKSIWPSKTEISSIPNPKKKESEGNDSQASVVLNNKNYNNIMELYKSGKDTASIAKQLNIGKGEVDLILGLAKMR